MKLYFFGSEWSFPSKASMKTWERFKDGNPSLETIYIDIRKRPDIASRYIIKTLPTFISVDNSGREYKRFSRLPTTIDLKDLLR